VHATGEREISTLVSMPGGAQLDHAFLRRVGDTVELSLVGMSSRRTLDRVLGKLPAGFRPSHDQSLVTCDDHFRHVRVDVRGGSGTVAVSQPKDADGLADVSTSLVWLTHDEWPKTLPGREWKSR